MVFGLERFDFSGILRYKNGYHRITIHRECTEPFLIASALAFCWIRHEGEAKRTTPSSHESDVKHVAKMEYELIIAVLCAARRYGMHGAFDELKLYTGHGLYLQSCPTDRMGRKIRQMFHPWTPPATPPSSPNGHELHQQGQTTLPAS
ncbi:hypothetical protein QFC19_000775 [Naganishia cerealis]|uniref:Uncharacterized protein n=1 Tax=Naganishia cerealis TaxID=610337 RepID=A0ACC2WM00_9TREE|nr:hypothetical protein QFC19_000775 [Naganishia cerealis]